MPPHELGHDPVGDVVDVVAVVALGRDPRVECHLEQHVAEFLAEGFLVTQFERVQGFVRLFQQVGRQ
jgi:hypothetical protein